MGTSPVTAWDILGALGTATGVPALTWEVWRWRREGPRIRVEASNAFPTYAARVGEHHFQITAVNVGRSEGHVKAWGLRLPDGSNLVGRGTSWSDTPGAIAAHGGRLNFYVLASDVIGTCRARGLRVADLTAWVELGTGKEIRGPHLPYTER